MRLRSWTAGFAAGLALALAAAADVCAQETQIPVPRVVIYPGDLISDGHLTEKALAPEAANGAAIFANRDGLVGKVAKQTLLPAAPIPLTAVREPYTVKQGQPTLVVFESGALVISATAVSLQPGSVGDVISLRNSDSGTTIRGVIQGDGTVRVGMP